MSPVTTQLIRIHVAAYLLELAYGDALFARFALWTLGRFAAPDLDAVVWFHPWQFVTAAFLHANVIHLFLNMLTLRIFGRDVEQALGACRYYEAW